MTGAFGGGTPAPVQLAGFPSPGFRGWGGHFGGCAPFWPSDSFVFDMDLSAQMLLKANRAIRNIPTSVATTETMLQTWISTGSLELSWAFLA